MLELRDITQAFLYRFKVIPVLKDINLTINEGDFAALMGISGSGKTTLLNIIAGLLKPSKEKIYFKGKRIINIDFFKSRFRRKNIGFVFQNFNLINYLSVVENVMLPFKFSSESPLNQKKHALTILEKLGIKDKAHYYPSMLSGGQLQRCAIARALVNNPALIIADEPTGNLDSETAHEILKVFKDLNKNEGITFIVVTHESEIIDMANEIYKLDSGNLFKGRFDTVKDKKA